MYQIYNYTRTRQKSSPYRSDLQMGCVIKMFDDERLNEQSTISYNTGPSIYFVYRNNEVLLKIAKKQISIRASKYLLSLHLNSVY